MSQTQRPAVLVTGADLAPQALALLTDFDVHYAGVKPTTADLIELVQTVDPVGIIVRYGVINAEVIDAARQLKVISKHGSGIDTIDVEYAKSRGVDVRAAVGANAVAVAEHALALMLACAKSLAPLHESMQQGKWLKSTHKSIELRDRTLGLVGLGEIGRLMASYGRVLGMKVIAYDPFVRVVPEGVEMVELDEIWAQSDVVSLHCPLTAENRNLINAQTIAQMKSGAILINTARGGLVEEQALIQALQSGKLRAAGVDSYQSEPPAPNHPFVGQPNLMMTPHIGGVSDQAYINMGVQATRNLIDSLQNASK